MVFNWHSYQYYSAIVKHDTLHNVTALSVSTDEKVIPNTIVGIEYNLFFLLNVIYYYQQALC